MTMKKYLDLFEAEQVSEKAVSQQQQKFMGMVHAMQKGEQVKGASPELKKVAKTMGKKDAADFAKTKHKDLPKQVTEDIMLDEGGNALKHIANRFKHEVKNFMNTGNMAENLYDALYDYYVDTGEMPYGVAKAREGDPYAWVEERFYADMGSGMSENTTMYEVAADDSLNELARLAGLAPTNEGVLDTVQTAVDKLTLPKSAHAAYDSRKTRQAEKQFQQSGSAYSDDAGTGYDREGNPKDMIGVRAQDFLDPKPNRDRDMYRMQQDQAGKNMQKESVDINECGDMPMDQDDRFNVSTNMSSDGTRSVNISAQGGKADELLQMLKMAGMRPHDDHAHTPAMVVVSGDEEMMDEGILGDRTFNRVMPVVKRIAGEVSDYDRDEFGEELWSLLDQKYGSKFAQSVLQDELDFYWNEYSELTDQGLDEERETEYANTPEEEYETVAAITRQGNDLNREKKQFADKPKLGDNPMASDKILDEELSALLDSILVREREGGAGGIAAEQPYRDEQSGRMIYPPRGATNPPQDPVSPAAKPPKESPSIFDREKPYKDPKTGRMITPPKGLSISEPVYPTTKGSR